MIETARRQQMIDAFKKSHGSDVAMALADSLDFTNLATKADLEPLATKADLEKLQSATKADLKVIDTRLDACATKADLKVIDTRLDACATKADMEAMGRALSKDFTSALNKHLWGVIGVMVALFAATGAQAIFGG